MAAIAEIGGAWLIWQGTREHRGVAFIGAGIAALAAYGFVATLQDGLPARRRPPAPSGRSRWAPIHAVGAGEGGTELEQVSPSLLRGAVAPEANTLISGVLLLVASRLDTTPKLLAWGLAVAIDYLGPLIGHMRGWRLSPSHFVERFGLITLIALGESVSPSGSASGISSSTRS